MLVLVPEEEWAAQGVPAHLQEACRRLNNALAIAPGPITLALDEPATLECLRDQQLIEDPWVICSEDHRGNPAVRGLGILNGAIASPPFCLSVTVKFDGAVYEKFNIMKETA